MRLVSPTLCLLAVVSVSSSFELGHFAFSSVSDSAFCTNSTIYGWVNQEEVEVTSESPFSLNPDVCANVPWLESSPDIREKVCFGVRFSAQQVDEQLLLSALPEPNIAGAPNCSFVFDHEEEHDDAVHIDEHLTWQVWIYSLAAVVGVSAVSLAGLAVLWCKLSFLLENMNELLAISAGTLLGAVFFSILPEVVAELGFTTSVAAVICFGVMFGYVFETLFHHHDYGHRHPHTNAHNGNVLFKPDLEEDTGSSAVSLSTAESSPASPDANNKAHLAVANLVADAVHNFVDGMLVGASFASSTSVGLTVTLSVMIHELPQEISDFAILLAAGFSYKRALLMNFLVALTSVAGCVVALLIADQSEAAVWLLPFSSGLFLYLSLCGILPALVHSGNKKEKEMEQDADSQEALAGRRASFFKIPLLVLFGIVLMALLTFLPNNGHAHGEAGGDPHASH